MAELVKNEIFESRMDGFTSDGSGVCRAAGRAVFVPRALPGELWRVRVVKAGRTAVWGRGEALLEQSPGRVEPLCPVYGKCGGCALRHADYDTELRFKLDKVNNALRRIGALSLRADTIFGADCLEGYRNKAIYNFGRGPVCGFYRTRSHDIVPLGQCLLTPPHFDNAAHALTQWMERTGTPAYDERSGEGAIRHLFLRQGDDELLACIVSARAVGADAADALRQACPSLTGVMLCTNTKPGNVVLDGPLTCLWGRDTVRQTLCGVRFTLSTPTFFQVNTTQAEKLCRLVRQYAQPTDKTIVDLYCGAGTLGLAAARDAARLIGNDITASAVENARGNAAANGVKNAEYICGDAVYIAKRLVESGLRPDVVITDPPRKGMDLRAMEAICAMEPARIIYVSCDPATLARDLSRMEDRGYKSESAIAVDMFPRTSHVETVVQLSQQKASTHIKVELDLDELDRTSAEAKATYQEIQDYVLKTHGLKVSNLYISQVKRKCGLEMGINYNLPKSDNARVPQCPQEKEAAIMDALRHFQMV